MANIKNRFGRASLLVITFIMVCLGGFVSADQSDERIVFHSDRDGNSEIYCVELPVVEETRLTFNDSYDGFPSWSPDGQLIVFQSDREGAAAIFIMKADGSDAKRIPNTENGRYPKWSFDGRYITFFAELNGNSEIFVINSDGSKPRNLTQHLATDETPSWSANGKTLAFQSDRNDVRKGDRSVEEWIYNFGLFTMASDGSAVLEITGTQTNDENPSIAPHGKQIVYQSYISNSLGIAVVNTITKEKRILTDLRYASGSPAWSSDGSKIVFDSNQDGNFEIFVMDANGSNQRQLTFTDHAENSGAAMYSGQYLP
jgi:TolB protein